MLSEKPWRAEFVMLFGVAQVVCLSLGLTLAMLLQKAGVAGFALPTDFGNLLFNTLSFQGATWLLIFFFLRLHQTGWAAAFGARDVKLTAALFAAVKCTALILPFVLLLQGSCVYALEKLGWLPEDQTAVLMLLNAKSWWVTFYFGVFAVVIAPVAEEFIFRGVLFPLFGQLGFHKFAWFGVSALFALIHMNLTLFIPLFVLALALTWLYEKTDNLLAPITAHALFNAVNFAVLLWQKSHPAHE